MTPSSTPAPHRHDTKLSRPGFGLPLMARNQQKKRFPSALFFDEAEYA
jgi:hypothetical protein